MMETGASSIHKQLRTNLEDYIKSQYFGKTPLLLSALEEHIDDEGLLYKKPFIESSPAYVSVENGIEKSSIPPWMKEYFTQLSEADIGVFKSPFVHQLSALEAAIEGKNLFVSTGTGSGKTECFMWPLLAKLAIEARESKSSWGKRGVRTIIMYPMNALISDQISRLRRMIGDQDGNFINIFRKTCGKEVRRPQFGMYTGRTPYPGPHSSKVQDRKLEKTLRRVSFPENDSEKEFFDHLLQEGKIPAKADMNQFLQNLHDGIHIPNDEDAELITRFEMQQFCPDILITNYSMLEYMLLRPREKKIWEDTREWLNESEKNKLLFIIDEAHMYRGSSGGEVALLIRRLFYKLGIRRNRVQFILTTASMPNRTKEDIDSVMKFANDLTASDTEINFCYLTGEQEYIDSQLKYDIPDSILLESSSANFEAKNDIRLSALLAFWRQIEGFDYNITDLKSLYNWMYDNLIYYRPFHELIKYCRGNAVSLDELSSRIFPELDHEIALRAVSVLLSIAPLAKNDKGAVLFPARMHMLFKGISGVYACTNPHCSHSHSDNGLTLGEIYLSDSNLYCPYCNSVVYELYNDRRCGALFFKGYILENDTDLHGNIYLWRYSGQLIDQMMKEIHLFIPTDDFQLPIRQGKNVIKPCYLDTRSGFINFTDDSLAAKPWARKLYYCNYSAKGRPQIITFPTCPHCRHQLSKSQLTSFSTRGNQSFFNLIKGQFQLQPAVPGKDDNPERFPNEGRKVLLFSDSRQRAAKLARDMSDASDISAARQLFVLAIEMMEADSKKRSMDYLYDYFCLAAAQSHVHIFHNLDRKKFAEDCDSAQKNQMRCKRRGREYKPRFTIANAPVQMQEYILRLFAGGYNTLYDSATSWLEPTEDALYDALDDLEESNIIVQEEEFVDFFNAWILSICDMYTAIGHTIKDTVRLKVRPNYGTYGLDADWKFSNVIRSIMGWDNENKDELIWKRVLKDGFLDSAQPDNGKLYVDMSRVRARFDDTHVWYKCEQCSELTPFIFRGRCPSCGSVHIHQMSSDEYKALDFWRKPIYEALQGEPIRVIDTEEHTAQLSYKDQRDELWSRTEQYELRFQDFIEDNETPVDILSSTTTMEVGIDIGSLVAVGLRNIPPMRENYQQRAGRAGRRGASLSTIITFCEDGPHDTLYFNNPVPMFRGDPRKPWIDVASEKLLQRHIAIVTLQEFLAKYNESLDIISAAVFLDHRLDEFAKYLTSYTMKKDNILLPSGTRFLYSRFVSELKDGFNVLKQKRINHPELFGAEEGAKIDAAKTLLDALYEEGIIPTYSFPKNVVNTYIPDISNPGRILYEVDRGLDVAIGEYAPGRSIVVDKQTYQIGGFYYPGSEYRAGKSSAPARAYTEDPNYVKQVLSCPKCGWFGLLEDKTKRCPFCGNHKLEISREMLRPWGFAPKNAESIPEVQLTEEYTAVQQPLYSTLPNAQEMRLVSGCKKIRIAARTNQRIIMLNKGLDNKGFMVCKDCGAAMPGDDVNVLKDIDRPYKSKKRCKKCYHTNSINVNLGYDFITDMMVLEFKMDNNIINVERDDNPWLDRAAQSLAEALRLVTSKKLDIEFTELVTGYRLRTGNESAYIDIYLYDSLSSGAGYAVSIADIMNEILLETKNHLKSCDCESACSKCLKHYRNQHVHGLLDRFAALQLLEWGMDANIAPKIPLNEQIKMIYPLKNILEQSGCKIDINDGIIATGKRNRKEIVIYPSMWRELCDPNTIFISDAYIKHGKPYAVKKIIDNV
ncbi:DEAD/DEAH box helicase [Mitsuokella jalaludinii]|uniref:DEAD/DEAH box helicase n=1 Tax=Mitsuokella jalaludinii TaxID=187979 RepID=UPI00298D2C00|nr:DEAD/DEAH box helicase [Mitsuokella jalaludinii]